ncbi:hypothetical protein PTKIN_Ptkin04bG0136700 [Pterospermum kingtungense]
MCCPFHDPKDTEGREEDAIDFNFHKLDFDLQDDDGDDNDQAYEPEFNSEIDMENPSFVKGMVFASREIFKDAIRQYGRKNKYNLKLVRNDKKKVKAICKSDCIWSLWAAKFDPNDAADPTCQIKTYVPYHGCLKDSKNKNITSTFIAKHYLDKFMTDPHYLITLLQQDVMNEFSHHVSLTKCIWTRLKALEIVNGNHKEQYGKIYEYLSELQVTNKGTTIICKLDCRLFQRMYVCLNAIKQEFKAGCRRIVSIDGCSLKGYYIGHLLVEVGIDANDCIYPLIDVVVKSKNYDSWCWFI